MERVDELLAKGLAAGYAGKIKPVEANRGPFVGKQVIYLLGDHDGGTYSDEWYASANGGGQEIAKTNGDTATRLYAGGIINPEKLAELGITEEEIMAYHKNKLTELGSRTRLQENCIPEPDGKLQYDYEVLEHLEELGLTIGLESITYDGNLVFAHGFLKSPIK